LDVSGGDGLGNLLVIPSDFADDFLAKSLVDFAVYL
jgi:hypothetical protein